jgi:glycosyltransferase involved in cell wall biosynthesis
VEKISVVINTLNEEKNLPRALASVKNFADEIVVVDMRSGDRTIEIATKFGAKVFGHERAGYVEPARNFAISKATGEWILVLDADEELGLNLRKELKNIVKNPKADYYRIPRKNIIFGKWVKHSRWWPDYNIRFFKKGNVAWNEVIHSVPMTQGSGTDIEAKEKNAIVHYHYETVEQFIGRLNRYTTEHSKILVERGYKFDWKDLIKKPSQEFLSRYFFGEGYKDGLHGLVLAALQAFSEFVLYLKVWQVEDFNTPDINIKTVVGEMKNAEKDMHYWQADSLYKETGEFQYRIKRKLKLS